MRWHPAGFGEIGGRGCRSGGRYKSRLSAEVGYSETASRSVVGFSSLGMGSPCLRALSRKQRMASSAMARASSRFTPKVQISGKFSSNGIAKTRGAAANFVNFHPAAMSGLHREWLLAARSAKIRHTCNKLGSSRIYPSDCPRYGSFGKACQRRRR